MEVILTQRATPSRAEWISKIYYDVSVPEADLGTRILLVRKLRVEGLAEKGEGKMLTSKRHEWILQLIKGPEITPVGNSPGRYTPNSPVSINTDSRQLAISPADVLDLSNQEFLVVHSGDRACAIPWDKISSLCFEQEQRIRMGHRPTPALAARSMLPFPFHQKKTV